MKNLRQKIVAVTLTFAMLVCAALPAGAAEQTTPTFPTAVAASGTPETAQTPEDAQTPAPIHPEDNLTARSQSEAPLYNSDGQSAWNSILTQNKNVRRVMGEVLLNSRPFYYSDYRSKANNMPAYTIDELQQFSYAIAGTTGSQYDRARTLYQWVASNISYGSYYAYPIDIFRERTGACEGYCMLLSDLLAAQGITSIIINVATNQGGGDWAVKPYSVTHSVLLAALDGQVYWLDPTWDEKTATHLNYFGQTDEEFSREHFAMSYGKTTANTYLYGEELFFTDNEALFSTGYGATGNRLGSGVKRWTLDNGVLRGDNGTNYPESGWYALTERSYFAGLYLDSCVYLKDGLALTGKQTIDGQTYTFSSTGILVSGEKDLADELPVTPLNTDCTNHSTYSESYYARFHLDNSGIVSFEFDNASGDVRMEMFDLETQGYVTYLWSNWAKAWKSQEFWLDAGDYFFWIGGPYSSTFDYRVNYRPDDGSVEREGNGSFETADPIACNQVVNASAASAYSDIDLYTFTLDSPQEVTIRTSHEAYSKTSGYWLTYLLDSSQRQLLSNDLLRDSSGVIYSDYVNSTGESYTTTLAAGQYYVLLISCLDVNSYKPDDPCLYQLTVSTKPLDVPDFGWCTIRGKDYWFENGIQQGTTGRGKEIYDPGTDAWYWLDAIQGGAKAVDKEVYMDYEGMQGDPKWVRYDTDGHMVKGWYNNGNGTYYYDLITGAMAKGDILLNGMHYGFDSATGVMLDKAWLTIDGGEYWYEGGIRQGCQLNADGTPDLSYRGKEIYDPASNAWYWLDNVDYGKKAVSKDVYQESEAGVWADRPDGTGKWVRYDANGGMIKGWSDDGMYYFDPMFGTMAKGVAVIDGQTYTFDVNTGRKL
ncbi:MAG: hypothetical protein U0L91_00100 [Gemmiger sp.]|uniref:hypothetical protein n=1 Tax=Gemmiger sp. TaxID=2049027 RepID=UPI002E798FC6|nr:hypothetical protein [Gemmiger sp.]MEE0799659.1 hypothetical protein [Gemmiger sp.]